MAADELFHGRAIGTYLKVVQFHTPFNPDGFIILYLRPRNNFLFLGYWQGYEYTKAAGEWSKRNDVITLHGHGTVKGDWDPVGKWLILERTFVMGANQHTPALIADTELKGWSLLSWTGSYTYVGQTTVINPHQHWLPDSLEEVDFWIEEIMRS